MLDLPSEYRPFFFVGATLLGVEIVYFLNLSDSPKDGWLVFLALLSLSVSVPMLVASSLAAMTGYSEQMKVLLWGGITFAVLWFFFCLLALSIIAGVTMAVVATVSYKMLQYSYLDRKKAASEA